SVIEGEREMGSDNKMVGRFNVTGIEAAGRGVGQIEVRFWIEVNGITKVWGKDMKTQKEQTITIENSSKLSEEEIQKFIKEGEGNKEADAKRKE
ncbi:Hsp70 family protein, partial [Mycoplasmopsis synoviae]